jgi:hypothetical protein
MQNAGQLPGLPLLGFGRCGLERTIIASQMTLLASRSAKVNGELSAFSSTSHLLTSPLYIRRIAWPAASAAEITSSAQHSVIWGDLRVYIAGFLQTDQRTCGNAARQGQLQGKLRALLSRSSQLRAARAH